MSLKSIDIVVKTIISAAEKGYEFRTIEDGEGHRTSFFYDPAKQTYDSKIKELLDRHENSSTMSEFITYSVYHPTLAFKFITGICKMALPEIKREQELRK